MNRTVGIYGLAHGHVLQYIDVLKTTKNIKIVGIYDHEEHRMNDIHFKYNLPKFKKSKELLNQKLDVVIVGSETSYHLQAIKEICNYGIDIILQKPFATSLNDAKKIIEYLKNSESRLYLAWQMRVDPQNLKIKEIVENKIIGDILIFRRKHTLPTHRMPAFENSWHVKKDLNIGMWADDAAHPIDYLYSIFGKADTVYCDIDSLVNSSIPDDNGIAIFRYTNGMFAEIMCSFTSDIGETTTEIIGTNGYLVQYYGDLTSCNQKHEYSKTLKWKIHGDENWTYSDIKSPKKHVSRIRSLVPEFLSFINGKIPPPPISYFESLKMTLDCYESSKKGEKIRI